MTMSYALENNDIEKIIEGIKNTFQGHPMIKAGKSINEHGKKAFVFTMEEMGSLIFSADQSGLYQMDSLEGEHKDIVCIGFNIWVKKYAGKAWPSISST